MLAALATFVGSAAPAGGLLGPDSGSGGLTGALQPILDPILDVVDHTLRPVTGLISDITGLPVDDAVSDVVDGIVDGLLGTVDAVVLPDDRPPLSPPGFEDLAGMAPLEPGDSLLEDVAHPGVIQPTGPVVGPVARAGGLVTEPLGLDRAFDSTVGTVRDVVLDPVGLDAAAYVVRATTPSGDETTRDALVDVPLPLDVTGDGADDVVVELRIVTARPSLRVSRLPGAPDHLPLAVEAIVAPGGHAAAERIAVGYDALDSDAPEVFRATVADLGTTDDQLAVEVHTVSPGPSVTLTASLFDRGPDGSRVDPTDARIGFSPVPADAAITAEGLSGAGGSGRVRVEVSEPSRVDAAVGVHAADGDHVEIGAILDQVPGTVDLAVDQTGDRALTLDYQASGPIDDIALRLAELRDGVLRRSTVGFEGVHATAATFVVAPDELTYQASAPIDALTLEIVDPTGVVDRATVLRARLAGLPEQLAVSLGDTGEVGLDAGDGVLGLLELQLASDPALDVGLAPGTDGFLLRDLADQYVVAARITGLRAVSITSGDGLAAGLRTLGGQPFVASVAQATASGVDQLDASLSSLPADVDLALTEAPAGTTLAYQASSVVDQLQVDVRRPGLDASLLVEQLPTAVDVTIGDDGVDWAADDGVPLITAQVRGDGTGLGRAADVRARLTGVPAAFSLGLTGGAVDLDAPGGIALVEVLASDGTTELGIPEGIDALLLRDTPTEFAAALRLTGLERLAFGADPLTLELGTAGGRTFAVDVTQEAADGSGTEVRATLADLPASLRLAFDDLAGTPTMSYAASSTIESLLASVVSRRADGGATTLALEVQDLPTALDLAFGDGTISYAASAIVPLLRLEMTDATGLFGRAHRMLVELTNLPLAFDVAISGESVSFDAGDGTLGSLEVLATNGPELALPEGTDGLLLVDEPIDFVVAARVVGLRGIAFDLGDAAGFRLRTTGGRLFELDLRQQAPDGARTALRATLDALPSEVALTFGGSLTGAGEGLALAYTASAVMEELRAELTSEAPGAAPTTASLRVTDLPTALDLTIGGDGTVAYAASSGVPVLELDLHDPEGIFGPATTLRLRAQGLPTGITASIDEAGGLAVTTSGGALQFLEALFTSGEEIGLGGDIDGIVFRDTAELYAAYVRITGLRGIGFAPAAGGADLSLDTDGGRVFVVDARTEDPADGSATAISATLDELPESVDLRLSDDPDTGLGLEYQASRSMDRLHGHVVLTGAEGTTSFGLEVLDLPTQVTFGLDSVTGALHYTASARATQLTIVGENPDGIFMAATRLQAVLRDLPTQLDINLGGEDAAAVTLRAGGGHLGLLEVLATTGPDVAPAPGVDGIVLRDTADEFVVAIRVHALREISVVPDPVALTIGTAGGETFVLDVLVDGGQVLDLGSGATSLQASFETLPTLVSLGFGLDGGQQVLGIDAASTIARAAFALTQTPEGGTPLSAAIVIEGVPTSLDLAIDIQGAVRYAASAPVPSLELDASDPAGLFDRADKLNLRLTGIPTGLDVALSETGAIQVTTSGGRLGQLEALAYLGTPAALAPEMDGVILQDLVDDYRVFARFTAINQVDVSQVPRPNVRLVGAGGRPLSIGLHEAAPGKPSPIPGVAFTTATLLNAPPTVELALLDGAPGTINVAYDASATASSLQFQTNAGERWITSASIADPVPLSFRACQTGNSACAPGLGQAAANVGSFSFIADRHTTLNVLDCSAPLNANCTPQNGTRFTHVSNLRVKTFQFAGDVNQGTVQAEVKLYANTVRPGLAFTSANADTVSGSIRNRDGNTRLNFTFGAGFKAWDRYKHVDRFPSLPFFGTRTRAQRGGVSCTSGTDLSVTVRFVFDLTFNANSLLC